MKIHEYSGFPGPRRVRMFLAEKGIESMEFEQIDVPGGAHRDEAFLAKNPYATVPVLELDDGAYISEAIAICRYFESAQPQPALMGTSPANRAEVEMWQRRVEQTMYDTIATYFHQGTAGLGDLETYQNTAWGQENKDRYEQALVRMDNHLEGREYIAGDQYSVADITALCAIGFAGFVEMTIPAELENLTRWYNAVSSRPSANA